MMTVVVMSLLLWLSVIHRQGAAGRVDSERSTYEKKDIEKEKDELITRQPALQTQIDHERTWFLRGNG
jgi:hypothetical protein